MSDKHLTELAWKALTIKQKIKDPGLGKALGAYGKCEEKDAAGRIKALDDVDKQAESLKKEHKKEAEIAGYLDEILKESGKTRKALEVLAKKGGGEEEGEGDEDEAESKEAEEYKKDLKKKMVSALAQVKSRAPGQPEPGEEASPQLKFMAYVAGGGSAVVVGSKVGGGAKKLLPEIAGATGGTFYMGECIFEEGIHTFVLDQAPGGLAKKLSKAIVGETGQKYKVRVRSANGTIDGEDDETETEESTGTKPTPGVDLEARWKQVKTGLYPDIKKALESNPPNRTEIVNMVGLATKDEKAMNFQGAIDTFAKLRTLLGVTAPPPPPPPPSSTPNPPPPTSGTVPPPPPMTPSMQAEFYQRRLKALMPGLTQALKGQIGDNSKMRAVAGFASEKAADGNYASALQALEALAKLLAAAGIATPTVSAPAPQSAPPPQEQAQDAGNQEEQKAEQEEENEVAQEGQQSAPKGPLAPVWNAAKEQVDAQIGAMQLKMRRYGDPDLSAVADELAQALGTYRTSINVALMNLDNAPAEKRVPMTAAALKVVQDYQTRIASDPNVDAADDNPFEVKVTIRSTLGKALNELAAALQA